MELEKRLGELSQNNIALTETLKKFKGTKMGSRRVKWDESRDCGRRWALTGWFIIKL